MKATARVSYLFFFKIAPKFCSVFVYALNVALRGIIPCSLAFHLVCANELCDVNQQKHTFKFNNINLKSVPLLVYVT
jgi:hypothetical protein